MISLQRLETVLAGKIMFVVEIIVSHTIENPDTQSELMLLKQYAPGNNTRFEPRIIGL